ncbi:FUSC family protein [Chryseolinea sp. T2]|uniref:FUSC family protein n=1 Tax=Chryseolinea sp. T2 TaxID=3129255 RepID=UPI0030782F42
MKYVPSRKIIIKAVVLTTLVMLSYFLGRQLSMLIHMPNENISGMWCAVSAIVVFDDLRENVKQLLKNRLLGTFIGSAIGVVWMYFIEDVVWSVCISLVLVSIIISLLKLDGALKIACTSVLIVSISTHGNTFNDIWITATMRFIESVLGGLMSLGATVVMEHSALFKESKSTSDV